MARSRNIKPGLFQNEYLAELPFETRLLFAGLPCYADREGRLEDRPKRIKMSMFPADSLDVDVMLCDLDRAGFIQRYAVDDIKYIQIVNFLKHQKPHQKEQASIIPSNDLGSVKQQPRQLPAALVTDSLNLVTDSFKKNTSTAARFDEWWDAYGKKVDRKKVLAIWKRRKLDRIADIIIADTKNRHAHHSKWPEFQPNPSTYLNGDRWEDEYEQDRRNQSRNGTGETAIQARDRRNREAIERADRGATA